MSVIAEEVRRLICDFGMKRVLVELIKHTELINTQNEEYLNKLVSNLKETLNNYEARYENSPD
jgi:hypothetical protein